MKLCPNCYTENQDNSNYCGHCKTDISHVAIEEEKSSLATAFKVVGIIEIICSIIVMIILRNEYEEFLALIVLIAGITNSLLWFGFGAIIGQLKKMVYIQERLYSRLSKHNQ